MKPPKIYQRLKKYIRTRFWIRKKRKAIKKNVAYIDLNMSYFYDRKVYYDSRDGTQDVSMDITYKLRTSSDGGPKHIIGSSVNNLLQMNKSLLKASRILERFERRVQRKGWFYDKMAINEKACRLRKEKWEAFAAKCAGVSTLDPNISIPD